MAYAANLPFWSFSAVRRPPPHSGSCSSDLQTLTSRVVSSATPLPLSMSGRIVFLRLLGEWHGWLAGCWPERVQLRPQEPQANRALAVYIAHALQLSSPPK